MLENKLAAIDATVLTAGGEFDVRRGGHKAAASRHGVQHPEPGCPPKHGERAENHQRPPNMSLSKPPMVWPPKGWHSVTSVIARQQLTSTGPSSTFMVEMVTVGRDKHIYSENERGGRFTGYHPKVGTSSKEAISDYHSAHATTS